MLRRLCAALALLASVTAAGAAEASLGAVQRNPERGAGAPIVRPTSLVLDEERLSLACSEESGVPVCAFEERTTVRNPGAAREDLAVAFYGVETRDVIMKVDGAPAAEAPSAEELDALDASVDGLAPVPGTYARPVSRKKSVDPRVDRAGFTLAAEPGTRHAIVVTGKIVGGQWRLREGYSSSAVVARHPLFSDKRVPSQFDLEHLLSPLRTWKGEPRIHVRVTYPSRWTLDVGGHGASGWVSGREGDRDVLSGTLTTNDAATIAMEIEPYLTPFRNGGPLIGIGGTTGPYSGVRGRIGYEVAAPDWMLYSLTADTDFRRRVILTPMIEAATPAVIILPSLGLGVGAPIQVAPETRVGVRLQGDLHVYPVGFVTSVDIYPRFGSSAPFTEVSLLAQIGL